MGAYTLLQDLTVATNSTSVVLNDFGTITKDDFVKFVVTHSAPNVSEFDVFIFANASTSTASYTTQRIVAEGTSIVPGRATNSSIGFTNQNTTNTIIGYIKLSENDRFNFFTNSSHDLGTDVLVDFRYGTSSGATFTSGITSLTFTGVTNGILTGSRIQIYKLAAEKVADFVTTTNSTQVNIPFPTGTFDPAIDKDSEYLLVSDITNSNTTTVCRYHLTPNDLTTLTGYHNQALVASGTGLFQNRTNTARILNSGPNDNNINHTHIKLSNIGAFTFQSYALNRTGSSGVEISNAFGSSLAENITSITKLNIVAEGVTTGIKAGSRFTLYKLYE